MSTLLYQQSNVEISWDDREMWLYVQWIGEQTLFAIQRDVEQLLRFLVSRNATSIFSDNCRVEGIWIPPKEWNAADWFLRMRQAGLRYFAGVYPSERFGHIPADALLESFAPGIARVFWSTDDALEWLRLQRRRESAKTQRIILPPELRRP